MPRVTRGFSESAGNEDKQESEDTEEEEEEEEGTQGTHGWSPISGKSKKNRYYCKGGDKVCGLAITSKEDCIRCDYCKDWYHPKCQELTVNAFRAVSKYDLLWVCIHCKPNVMALMKAGKGLETCIERSEAKILDSLKESKVNNDFHEELKEKIQKMEETVSQIREKQITLETSMKEQKEVVKAVPKYSEELKNSAQKIEKLVDTQGKENRDRNIILHNIPESSSQDPEARKKHDTESFQKVAKALLKSDAKEEQIQVLRLGKRPDPSEQNQEIDRRPRLMMIKLKNKETVNELIKKRTQLREAGFPNVFITRDLTPEERAVQKTLRDELRQKGRETHKIFRGRVVPRN